jgi:hypothetical protein
MIRPDYSYGGIGIVRDDSVRGVEGNTGGRAYQPLASSGSHR